MTYTEINSFLSELSFVVEQNEAQEISTQYPNGHDVGIYKFWV